MLQQKCFFCHAWEHENVLFPHSWTCLAQQSVICVSVKLMFAMKHAETGAQSLRRGCRGNRLPVLQQRILFHHVLMNPHLVRSEETLVSLAAINKALLFQEEDACLSPWILGFFCEWPSALLSSLPRSHHLNSLLLTSHFRIDHLRSRPFVLRGGAVNADLRRGGGGGDGRRTLKES